MSTKRIITKFAAIPLAASAVAAAALAAVVTATPAQAGACTSWKFNGPFTFKDSNGWTITAATFDNSIRGLATGRHTGGMSMEGSASGGVGESGHVFFRVEWRNGSEGKYSGLVDNNGFAHGHNEEEANPRNTASWDSTVALACAASPPTQPSPPSSNPQPYGAKTCKTGYVWREARNGDTVCVTPDVRDRTARENAKPSANKDPNGDYGPESCKQGFVWREAFDGDTICVTPDVRAQTLADNAAEKSRYQSS